MKLFIVPFPFKRLTTKAKVLKRWEANEDWQFTGSCTHVRKGDVERFGTTALLIGSRMNLDGLLTHTDGGIVEINLSQYPRVGEERTPKDATKTNRRKK